MCTKYKNIGNQFMLVDKKYQKLGFIFYKKLYNFKIFSYQLPRLKLAPNFCGKNQTHVQFHLLFYTYWSFDFHFDKKQKCHNENVTLFYNINKNLTRAS